MALIRLVDLLFDAYILLIIVRVVLSWVQVGPHHPLAALVYRFTDPVLDPVRKHMGAVGPFDFSPMIVIILLIVMRALVIRLLGVMVLGI